MNKRVLITGGAGFVGSNLAERLLRDGREDQGWVAHCALAVLRNQRLTIYGDGRQVRDIFHIDDLIDAMLMAMDDIDLLAGKAFDIGGGPDNAVSLLEVIRYLSQLSQAEPEVRHGSWREGDQPYYVSDTRRFTETTGWTPRISVEQGISQLHHGLLDVAQSGVSQPRE